MITGDTGLFQHTLHGSDYYFVIYLLKANHVKESVLDSGFHAIDSGFQVMDSSFCQWNLVSGIPDSFSSIPYSKAQNFCFHKAMFPGFRIREPLHGAKYYNTEI